MSPNRESMLTYFYPFEAFSGLPKLINLEVSVINWQNNQAI